MAHTPCHACINHNNTRLQTIPFLFTSITQGTISYSSLACNISIGHFGDKIIRLLSTFFGLCQNATQAQAPYIPNSSDSLTGIEVLGISGKKSVKGVAIVHLFLGSPLINNSRRPDQEHV
jgi:hypothetical protein